MKKNMIAAFIAFIIVLSINIIPAMAAPDNAVSPMAATHNSNSTTYVKDSKGNQYVLHATGIMLNYDVTLQTGFSISKYADSSSTGKKTVENYKKSYSVRGEASYLFSLTETPPILYASESNVTGATGQVTKRYTYPKYLFSIFGGHQFSCNGASAYGTTLCQLF